jgi:Mg-chelatase subunit ChlD
MDTVRIASPHLLALLVPAWGLILYVALRRKHPGGSGRRPGAGVRAALACLATGLLVLALAGPSLRVSRLGAGPVIIAEDVSPSLRPGGPPKSAADRLAPYAAAVPPHEVGLVQFAGRAVTAAAPRTPAAERLARADAWPPETAVQAEAETDIAAALEQAGAAMPNGRGIVLLYSDGRETRGDALRAATSLAACGIQVHAVRPTFAPRDVGILSIAAPAEAPLGRPIQIEIRLAATVPLAATVRLERRRSDGPQDPPRRWDRSVQVDAAADATLLFEDAPPAAGVYEYRAEVASSADDWPENNRAACLVRVGEARQVIYIYGGSGPSGLVAILERALPTGATLRPAPAAPFRLPEVGGVTLVLDNVSAWALGKDRADGLARRVTDGGLGLLVLGGDEAFAAGGYGDSPLEDLLPVTSRTGRRRPLEMVLVVDSSGSMNESVGGRSKLTLAKQAVLALRPALGEGDRIGLVAFAGEPRVASPLVPVSEWTTLEPRVVEMVAGGGTRLTPAVEAAVGLFPPPAPEPVPERHILLLSDGLSEDFDVPRLIAACRRAGISVSAVATGQVAAGDSTGRDVDLPRLARLARGTGGHVHDVRDLARLSETFLHDMAWARGEGLRPGTRPTAWLKPEPIWPTAGGALPPVDAYNETLDKPGADVQWRARMLPNEPPRLVTPPLLATWQRGLGRVAAMPWLVSQAGEAWTAGERIGKDLAAVIEWLHTPQVPADWSARLVERNGSWWVRAEERAERIGQSSSPFDPLRATPSMVEGSPLVAAVFGAGGFKEERRSLEAVGPGVYETRIGPRGGPAAMVVVRRENSAASQTVSVPEAPPREFERFGVDRAALEAIVRAGGGMIHTDPETLAEAVRNFETRDFLPVGVYLVWTAVAVIVIQAGLRLAGRL